MAHPTPATAASQSYFYGRITREEAEVILRERGCREGLFLLRESISPMGDYAISVCHENAVHHYSLQKQTDGTYMIPQGQKFQGPVELLEHYAENLDGFITRPRVPCERLPNQEPVAFRGISYPEFEEEIHKQAKSIRNLKANIAFGAKRDSLVMRVAKKLHERQPWYHGNITREESESRLRNNKLVTGHFLMRQKPEKTYVLSVAVNTMVKHYLITQQSDKFCIEDGPRFDCLIILVDHYHNKQDGLATKLIGPCPVPNYDHGKLQRYLSISTEIFAQGRNTAPGYEASPPPLPGPRPGAGVSRSSSNVSTTSNGSYRKDSVSSTGSNSSLNRHDSRRLPPIPTEAPPPVRPSRTNLRHDQSLWTEPDHDESLPSTSLTISGHRLEEDYVRLSELRRGQMELRRDQLELQDQLGAGQFGSVVRGMCNLEGRRPVPVAIKTLKKEDTAAQHGAEPEILKEARLMKELDHRHIVRMIGLCHSDVIMLVLELAPLGQLNKYLSKHKDMPTHNVVELMAQVAEGMAYLEERKFVHRDLAARNVLLVDEHFAKISDFGMSKALQRGDNYYEAQNAGKWPLKWYAIECIQYWKFDSKSDVWSYGVTLWEAMSYGAKPYAKMKGQDIIAFLEKGQRLSQPAKCPDSVYAVMYDCWIEEKDVRPFFRDLVPRMKKVLGDLHR